MNIYILIILLARKRISMARLCGGQGDLRLRSSQQNYVSHGVAHLYRIEKRALLSCAVYGQRACDC